MNMKEIKYTKRELDRIRKALPPNGFQLIAERLGNTSAEAVRKILSEPERYRLDVFDAAKVIIIDYKQKVQTQKQEVMEVVK
jgi:hypothetical protein